jgi:diaminopimelate epimerase
MVVWERGGTLACGTGACALVVAGVLKPSISTVLPVRAATLRAFCLYVSCRRRDECQIGITMCAPSSTIISSGPHTFVLAQLRR